jgi:hypothetical protein
MTLMNYKLTIDINLMYADPKLPAMDTLKRWKSEGKIDLIEAEPPRNASSYGWPGAPAKPTYQAGNFRGKTRARVTKSAPGGINFNGVAAVLFPQRDPQKLHMSEINDVAHLIKHHMNKHELFVTANLKDFIEGGKKERLKASFGIIAMTPDEAVEMLSKMEGWK